DGVGDEAFGLLRTKVRYRTITFSAFPAGVGHVKLLGFLLARHEYLFGVDNHDEVARIQMRRKDGLILAAQNVGYFSGKAAQNGAIGIDYVPFSLLRIRFG